MVPLHNNNERMNQNNTTVKEFDALEQSITSNNKEQVNVISGNSNVTPEHKKLPSDENRNRMSVDNFKKEVFHPKRLRKRYVLNDTFSSEPCTEHAFDEKFLHEWFNPPPPPQPPLGPFPPEVDENEPGTVLILSGLHRNYEHFLAELIWNKKKLNFCILLRVRYGPKLGVQPIAPFLTTLIGKKGG